MTKEGRKAGGVRWVWALMLPRALLAAVLMFLAWQAVVFLRPRPRALSPSEVQAVARACAQAVRRMEASLDGPVRFGVMRLTGEGGEPATGVLRQSLAAHRGWTLNESSVIQTFLQDVGHAVAQATSLDEIAGAGRQVGLDVVMGGRVLGLRKGGQGAAGADLHLWAYDVRSAAWLLREEVSGEWRPGWTDRARVRILSMGGSARLVLWILLVAALPWVTAGLTHRVLAKRSNLASGLLITGYTLVGLALAGLLSGGALSLLQALIATATAALYSLLACERIAKL